MWSQVPSQLQPTETCQRGSSVGFIFSLCLCLPAATLHRGLHDAPAGDGRVSEEVQRQAETQGSAFSHSQSAGY